MLMAPLTRRRAAVVLLLATLWLAAPAAPAQDRTAPQARALAAVLKPYVDRGELAGAVVLVADRDKILDLEAVGYADLAARTLMGADALFWIASESKPITAAALLLLVDA